MNFKETEIKRIQILTLMNAFYLKLSDPLKVEFYKAFNQENEEEIILFFRKFLQFLENDDKPYHTLMCFNNPSKDLENIEFMKNFNRTCETFLNSIIKNKNDPNFKEIVGIAFCYIGVGHEYGVFGYPLNNEETLYYYKLSSQLNCDLGTYMLANSYESGKGTTVDHDKALYFYRCAAKLGLTDALHIYGSALVNGFFDSPIDEKTGLHYLSLAAINADTIYPYPLFDIGRWYERENINADVIVDKEYSFEVYMKGANLNDPNCQNRIARCYELGELKKKVNMREAIYWYKRAAEGGQIDAQLKLFGFYRSGAQGIVRKDLGASYFWALRAGLKGSARSVFYLGELALTGSGIAQDILLALWWYSISSTMGSKEGCAKMITILEEVNRRDLGPFLPVSCCDYLLCRYEKFRT